MVQHRFEVLFGVCRRMISRQRCGCFFEALEVGIQIVLPGRAVKTCLVHRLVRSLGETLSARVNAGQKVFQLLF